MDLALFCIDSNEDKHPTMEQVVAALQNLEREKENEKKKGAKKGKKLQSIFNNISIGGKKKR